MRSRRVGTLSGSSMIGLGLGVLAGVAAGLLVAPVRGSQMRESLRSRADHALDRGMRLIEEGRRAFRTASAGETGPLTATVGEMTGTRSGGVRSGFEVWS